jgi:hypothetical protein
MLRPGVLCAASSSSIIVIVIIIEWRQHLEGNRIDVRCIISRR